MKCVLHQTVETPIGFTPFHTAEIGVLPPQRSVKAVLRVFDQSHLCEPIEESLIENLGQCENLKRAKLLGFQVFEKTILKLNW